MPQILGSIPDSAFWISRWQQAAEGSRFHEVYPDETVIWNQSARAFDSGMGKSGAREGALLEILARIGFLPDAGMPVPGKRALDIGSGTGSLALPLAQCGIAVDALDNSEQMNQILREKCAAAGIAPKKEGIEAEIEAGKISIIAEDFRSWDMPEGTYDLVLGSMNPCLYNPVAFHRMLALSRDAVVYIGIAGQAPAGGASAEKPLVEQITGIPPGHNGSNHVVYPFNILLAMGLQPVISYVHDYWERREETEQAIARLLAQYAHFADKYPQAPDIIRAHVAQRAQDGYFVERGGGTLGIVACRKGGQGRAV